MRVFVSGLGSWELCTVPPYEGGQPEAVPRRNETRFPGAKMRHRNAMRVKCPSLGCDYLLQ